LKSEESVKRWVIEEDLMLVERTRNYFFEDSPTVETGIPITQCAMHRELVVEAGF